MASEEIGLQGLEDYQLGRVMSTSMKFCCPWFLSECQREATSFLQYESQCS